MTLRIFVPKSRNHFNIPDGSAPFRSSRTAPFAGSAQMEDVGLSSPEPAVDNAIAAGAISFGRFSLFAGIISSRALRKKTALKSKNAAVTRRYGRAILVAERHSAELSDRQ